MILGLAGKAAAGKDTLLPAFEQRGFAVIDADKLGHQALTALSGPLMERFGARDRKALGQIVFRDPRALQDLEALTHPWILRAIEQELLATDGPCVINAALLSKFATSLPLDAVIWVQAPWWTRLARARARDQRPWRVLLGRLWAQRKLHPQDFPAGVDIHIVENPARPEQAMNALSGILDSLMSVFPERKP